MHQLVDSADFGEARFRHCPLSAPRNRHLWANLQDRNSHIGHGARDIVAARSDAGLLLFVNGEPLFLYRRMKWLRHSSQLPSVSRVLLAYFYEIPLAEKD